MDFDSENATPPDSVRAQETEPEQETPAPGREGDRLFFRVAVLFFFAVFLYVLRDELSPVLICLSLLCLMFFTYKGIRFEIGLGAVACLLFAAWFFAEMAGLLWPFVLSFVLAYLLAPLVGMMGRRIPRTAAIGIIALLILAIMSGIGAVIIPRVIDESRELVRQLPSYGNAIRGGFERVLSQVRSLGYDVSDKEIQEWFGEQLPEVGRIFADQTAAALKGFTSGLAAMLNLLMIPFVTFYVLKDYELIKRSLKGMLPRRYLENTTTILTGVDVVLGQYVRGQLLVCGFIAMLTSSGLALFSIPYAVVLGLMAGLFNLVPFVGLAISLGVASLVALLGVDPLPNLLKVVGVFVVVQGIEGNFLSPRVVGQRVGLHPAWVMVALVVSAHFWGFIGMVVAIPVAAVINILVKVIGGIYYSSHYYGHTAE